MQCYSDIIINSQKGLNMNKIVLSIFAMITILILSNCSTNVISPKKQKVLFAQEKACIGKADGTASQYFEDAGNGNACYEVANFYEYLYYGKEYSKSKKAALQKSLIFYKKGCALDNAKSCGALAFEEIQSQKRRYGSFRSNSKFVAYAEKAFNLGQKQWRHKLASHYKGSKFYGKAKYYDNKALMDKFSTYTLYKKYVDSIELKRKKLIQKKNKKEKTRRAKFSARPCSLGMGAIAAMHAECNMNAWASGKTNKTCYRRLMIKKLRRQGCKNI